MRRAAASRYRGAVRSRVGEGTPWGLIGLGFGLLAACTSVLDTGVVIGGDEDSGTTAVPEDSTTGTPPNTDGGSTAVHDPGTTGEAVSTTGAAAASTSEGTSSTDTGEPPDDTGDSDGGPGPVGSPCGFEQKVCVLLEVGGEPVGDCGGTVEIKGIVQPLGDGRFSLQDCGACELCGGPTYEIEVFAPDMWIPDALPLCSRISVDFAAAGDDPYACAFVGASVWEDSGLGEAPSPVWVGTSIATDPPTSVTGLEVTADNIEPDECDESDCCSVDPGSYVLTFEGSAVERPFDLEESEEAPDVLAFASTYDFWIERAHAHKECDRIPHFDWIARRQ